MTSWWCCHTQETRCGNWIYNLKSYFLQKVIKGRNRFLECSLTTNQHLKNEEIYLLYKNADCYFWNSEQSLFAFSYLLLWYLHFLFKIMFNSFITFHFSISIEWLVYMDNKQASCAKQDSVFFIWQKPKQQQPFAGRTTLPATEWWKTTQQSFFCLSNR